MRDNSVLRERLDFIWRTYFPDIKRANDVIIGFGRNVRKRLGSIRATRQTPIKTKIIINGRFKNTRIPSFIIDATIAHELCHYAHGFASPLPKLFEHPHKGGLIKKEMRERGLSKLLIKEEDWLNKYWLKFNHTDL